MGQMKNTSAVDKSRNERLLEWIARGLKKPGKTSEGLAKAVGCKGPVGTRMRQGQRKIIAHELALIAAYLGEPVPVELHGSSALISFAQEAYVERVRETFSGKVSSKKRRAIPRLREIGREIGVDFEHLVAQVVPKTKLAQARRLMEDA